LDNSIGQQHWTTALDNGIGKLIGSGVGECVGKWHWKFGLQMGVGK
jgi:hypothetical protein